MANFNIDYLIVAGGGGGGAGYTASTVGTGGGGGAGGYLTNVGSTSLSLNTSTSYTITIGSGGSGGAPSVNSSSGSDSIFSGTGITTIQATGGGRGGMYNNSNIGGSGGSGGGTGYSGGFAAGGSGNTPSTTPSQGNDGGDYYEASPYGGSGGGGAGSAGSDGPLNVDGGSGVANSITGTSTFYAAGGGGGKPGTSGTQAGGSGIGGNGGNASSLNGTNGVANTGSGGGGAGHPFATGNNSGSAGDGGSGIVILRYATADANYTATGLTPTETTDGTDTILSFTTVGTGTITFTTPIPPFNPTKVTTPVTDFNKINTEEGLKIPSGTSSNQPTGVEGMVRNDTTQSSKGSSSTITYYNGTNWRYFENELNTSFNTVLFQSNNQLAQSITGVGFQPDLILGKTVQTAASWDVYDSIRGGSSYLATNLSNAAATGNYVTSFDSNGFSLGTDSNFNYYNNQESVAYCFKAGGLINKAADFNGSSSYSDIGGNLVNNLTSITLSAWVYTDPNTQYSYVMHVGDVGTAGEAFSISRWNNTASSGYDAYTVYANIGGGNIDGNYVLNENTWYHIAVTWVGTTMKFYVNGNLTTTATTSSLSIPASGNSGYIGRYISNQSYNWKGKINQVRIFNNALSSSEITQLYNETKADNSVLNFPNGAGCVAAYPLGENANGVDGLYNGTASNVTFGKPGYLTRNNEGTIESTVSVNNDLGFSIASYTGNGTAGATVGHGLDSTPEMVIVKRLSGIENWAVYTAYSHPTAPENYLLTLDENYAASLNSTRWNNTAPTSVTFSVGTSQAVNASSNNYIAYCFTSKPNYSKVGSYTGANSSVFVSTGFEPAFVMIKFTSGSIGYGGWFIYDNKRDTTNPVSVFLQANTNGTEINNSSYSISFNSTGFTVGSTQNDGINYNNNEYIYYAVANTI